jgi:hypothetical protein
VSPAEYAVLNWAPDSIFKVADLKVEQEKLTPVLAR